MSANFALRLSDLRKEKNLSQKEAASCLGVSQALLSHYEKGIRECGLDFLKRACDYYDVTSDYLLGLTDSRNGLNDIYDIIDCYKHVILNRIFEFVYEGVMTIKEKELFGTNRLLQELIWHEGLEKTNKFGMIRDLLDELEKDKTFETLEYVVDEIQKQCEVLKIDCDVFALKGLRHAKRIVKAHGSLYDENNLFKTFNQTNNYFCNLVLM